MDRVVEKSLSRPDFYLVFFCPRRLSFTLLTMLEDRKIAYGFLISKQNLVCSNAFSILKYDGFFALLRCFC